MNESKFVLTLIKNGVSLVAFMTIGLNLQNANAVVYQDAAAAQAEAQKQIHEAMKELAKGRRGAAVVQEQAEQQVKDALQRRGRLGRRGAVEIVVNGVLVGQGQRQQDEREVEKIEGSAVKTDPELEALLERAVRSRDDGNYFAATKLWQAVLDRSGDSLYSSDDKTYYSLVHQVEKLIATLPAEGLELYRISADASARELIAKGDGPNDIQSLSQVVRQYFLSSEGDDAAFRLAGIYIDQYDLVGARRMLEKIVEQYPDPSVSLDEINVRIALCYSFDGDEASANAALNRISPDSQLRQISLVKDSLGKLRLESQNPGGVQGYTMPMGDSKRYGVMPSVPNWMMDSDLVASFQYFFETSEQYRKWADCKGVLMMGQEEILKVANETVSSSEKKMTAAWKEKNWRPAGQLIFDGDRVFLKSVADQVVLQRNGNAGSKSSPAPTFELDWRPLWRNKFPLDDASKQLGNLQSQLRFGGRRRGSSYRRDDSMPTRETEVQLFGDSIFQQMSIHDNVLYCLEGKSFDDKAPTPESNRFQGEIRRTRSNFLTAYDAKSGNFLWKLPRVPTDNDGQDDFESMPKWIDSGGMMSAPISYAGMLIVAVNEGGAIAAYAIDPQQEGKTIWKSFLCDESESGAKQWASIDLSIDGSDLFVSCGSGVVFVLEPATGMVRFAKRYERNGTRARSYRPSWATPGRVRFKGWSSDIVIPYGRQMVCFCSDSQMIRALDRSTGDELWNMKIETAWDNIKIDYLLGVHNDVLYAAGHESVIAVDLKKEGRLIWGGKQCFDGKISYGRGMLTANGIYIPVEDMIYKLDLNGGKSLATNLVKVVAKVKVNTGVDAPVGNLFSDGRQIWVHSGNRVSALWPKVKSRSNKKKTESDESTERSSRRGG